VADRQRLVVAALLVLLAPLGGHVEALALSIIVAGLLSALAIWELRDRALSPDGLPRRAVPPTQRA
jgi:hypothetical protein